MLGNWFVVVLLWLTECYSCQLMATLQKAFMLQKFSEPFLSTFT